MHFVVTDVNEEVPISNQPRIRSKHKAKKHESCQIGQFVAPKELTGGVLQRTIFTVGLTHLFRELPAALFQLGASSGTPRNPEQTSVE